MQGTIRPLALALIRRGEDLLVDEGRDEVKDETFFRLLGGRIEFGERGAEALRRELREELGVEAEVERHLATVENIFTFEGKPGHEIALIYECSLRDRRLYELDESEAREETPEGSLTHILAWKPLASFVDGGERLYPEGVADLAAGSS